MTLERRTTSWPCLTVLLATCSLVLISCASDGIYPDTSLTVEMDGELDSLDARLIEGSEQPVEAERLAAGCNIAWQSANGRALDRRVVIGRNQVLLRAAEIVRNGEASHAEVSSVISAAIEAGAVDDLASFTLNSDVWSSLDVDENLVGLLMVPVSESFTQDNLVMIYPTTLSKRVLVVVGLADLKSASVSVLPAIVGAVGQDGVLDVSEYNGDDCD